MKNLGFCRLAVESETCLLLSFDFDFTTDGEAATNDEKLHRTRLCPRRIAS